MEPAEPALIALECEGTGVAAPGEPLEVRIVLDSVPEEAGGRVLIRVDALRDGSIVIRDPDPTAAAVALAVTPAGRFQGCITSGATTVRLQAAAHHLSKAWLRVTADRVTRVRLEHALGSELETVEAVVPPGESGVATWQTGG